MAADRRDLSGLLYLPSEELVRSTVDGVEADWSDARAYVPSPVVVRRVLDASGRARPRFVLPPWLAPSTPVTGATKRERVAAAMLGAFGLSPTALAAVTLAHLLALGAAGPWISAWVRAARAHPLPQPPAIAVVPLFYGSSATPQPATRPQASWRAGRLETEAAAALSQEIRLSGPALEVHREDRPKLELIVMILNTWPGLRLRVVGEGPLPPGGRVAPGAREAQAFIRRLVAAGISESRIEWGRFPESNRRCAERGLSCRAEPSRVRTMEASAGSERRR